ncbi:MAG: hypothetical protein EOO20_22235 [Chryseobacterium sp.]|nr:MAG: hypothetical protein EOO20_22235 [Chryseobacterium sp.]
MILQTLSPISDLNPIITGNSPYDGGNLILSSEEKANLEREQPDVYRLIKRLYGSQDYLNGGQRFCLWIDDDNLAFAESIQSVQRRIDKVKAFRKAGGEVAKGLAKRSHQFRYTHQANKHLIIAPRVSSERRKYSIWLTFK